MTCSRCFHAVGEHLLCRNHGGPSGWTSGAYKLKPKPQSEPMPSEAIGNLQHHWWDFLDQTDAAPSRIGTYKVAATKALKEFIP